jgi:hypothetical protein
MKLVLFAHFSYIFNVFFHVNLCFLFLYIFPILALWHDDNPSLRSKPAVIRIKLFTSELVVTVNI